MFRDGLTSVSSGGSNAPLIATLGGKIGTRNSKNRNMAIRWLN